MTRPKCPPAARSVADKTARKLPAPDKKSPLVVTSDGGSKPDGKREAC